MNEDRGKICAHFPPATRWQTPTVAPSVTTCSRIDPQGAEDSIPWKGEDTVTSS